MSRLLVIALLLWLPFQFTWGAAAGYCQHEQGEGVSHFGHHHHRHEGKSPERAGAVTPDRNASMADEDFDCAFCQISCAQAHALMPVVVRCPIELRSHLAPGTSFGGYQPLIPNPIERPKWTLAA